MALHPGADTNPATADLVPTTTDRGTFWSVQESPANLLENTDRRLTAQYRPIEPQYAVEVTPATGAAQARGALITSLTSTDVPNVDPVNFRPTIDQSADEPEPAVDDAAFPDNLGGLTTFSDAQGPRQQLILNVGQFLQNQSVTGAGTQRLFTSIGGTVYYEPATNTDVTPPTITHTDAVNAPGTPATFHVTASDDAGIARVVVLSTDQATPGTWQTTELVVRRRRHVARHGGDTRRPVTRSSTSSRCSTSTATWRPVRTRPSTTSPTPTPTHPRCRPPRRPRRRSPTRTSP